MRHAVQRQPRLHLALTGNAGDVMALVDIVLRAGDLALADVVDPQISQNLEHPRVEARPWLETLLVGERPFAGALDKIVRDVAGPAQRNREPAQIRQKSDKLILDAVGLFRHVAPGSGIKRPRARSSQG